MYKIVVFFACIFFCGCSDSDQSTIQNQKFDSIFNSMVSNGFTGAMLIAENGNPVYINTHGFTNLTDSISINKNSVFELASVSKQFTAAGIALLEQEGKINTEESISKYLPELVHYKNISIANLIHHTSGLPEYDAGEWVYDRSAFITNDSIIAYLSRNKPELNFEVGDQHEYNNTGYILLASIIEKVSGSTFGDFLKTNIFEPAKMKDSRVYRSRYKPEEIDNYAVSFIYADSLSKNITPDDHHDYNYIVHLDGIQGDGMVNSTLMDLLKWDRFLYTEEVFSIKTKDKLFAEQQLNDGSPNDYAYGWRVKEDEVYGKIMSHSGTWPAYITYFERHIETDKTIIMLQNNYNVVNIPHKIIRSKLYPITVPIEEKKSIVGKYEFTDDQTILTVGLDDSGVFSVYDNDTSYLIPITENVYFLENVQSVEIEFIKDQENKFTTAKWDQGNYKAALNKIE